MITRDEIRSQIEAGLTSPEWLQLKNSLVGSELVSLGTEIVYRAALVADSFKNSFNNESCSYSDLITLASRNSVAVSNNEPSFVTINELTSGAITPFSSSVSFGSVRFYPVTYSAASSKVKFYQGVPVQIYSTNPSTRYKSERDVQISDALKVKIDNRTYIRLSPDALPESIRLVIPKDGKEYDVPQYSSNISGDGYFQVVTLPDGCVAINISDFPYVPTQWSCFYLQLTHDDIDTTTAQYTDLTGTTTDATIASLHIGTPNNLDYARKSYDNWFYTTHVINSITDVKKYVRSFSEVLDCNVVATRELVTVYVKPVVPGSIDTYEAITYCLSLYGNMFQAYSVQQGIPVQVTLVASTKDSIDPDVRVRIEDLVSTELAYDKLKFDDAIDTYSLSSEILQNEGVRVDLSLIMVEPIQAIVGSTTLAATPDKDSVVLTYKISPDLPSNEVGAWQYNGIIYEGYEQGYESVSTTNGNLGSLILYFDSTHQEIIGIDPLSRMVAKTGVTGDFINFRGFATSSGPALRYTIGGGATLETYYPSNIWDVPSRSSLTESSGQHIPRSLVRKTFTGVPTGIQSAYVLGDDLYCAVRSSGEYVVYKNTGSSSTQVGSIALSFGDVVGAIRVDSKILFVTSDSYAFLFDPSSNETTDVSSLFRQFAGSLSAGDTCRVLSYDNGSVYVAVESSGVQSVRILHSFSTFGGLTFKNSTIFVPDAILSDSVYYGSSTCIASKSPDALKIYIDGSVLESTFFSGDALLTVVPDPAGIVSGNTITLDRTITADTVHYRSHSTGTPEPNKYYVLSDDKVVWE